MKIKKNKRLSIYKILGLIAIIILFFTFFLFMKFNKKITPRLLNVAAASINKLNETILTNYRVKDIYKQVDLENCIKVVKNNKDEIITVDFNLERVYEALSILTEYIQKSVGDHTLRKEILNNYNEDLSSGLDSIVLSLPIGISSDGLYLVNLGPRIPVKVNYMGYVSSSVRIKLEDYGINNALISIYIDCFINNEFIAPFREEKINHEYNILIYSKIIQGIVPTYFGGSIEKKSSLLSLPIN